MKIRKVYFSLDEIRERWRLCERDLAYLAENGEVNVSVRVFSLPIEICSVEEDFDGTWFSVPHTRTRFSGLLDLHARDAFRVFRDGTAIIHHFLAADGDGASLLPDTDEVHIRKGDLLVRKEERDRYERVTGFTVSDRSMKATAAMDREPPGPPASFCHSPDYREIRCGIVTYHFGTIQAEVVRALHAAHCAGEPWQSGKILLTRAGSKSMKMVDVFKSQPGWRQLIESNHRGYYRLSIEHEAP